MNETLPFHMSSLQHIPLGACDDCARVRAWVQWSVCERVCVCG
jgi:hypothetical protein